MERPNNKNSITLEQVRERVQGYFEGKQDELNQEITSFQELGEGVRIEAGKIIRPELSIEALQRVKSELLAAEKYFLEIIKRLSLHEKETL